MVSAQTGSYCSTTHQAGDRQPRFKASSCILSTPKHALIAATLAFCPWASAEQWQPRTLILQPWNALLNLLPLLAVIALLACLPLAMIYAARNARIAKRHPMPRDTALLDALPYPVVIRDRELKLIAWNAAYALECDRSGRPLQGTGIVETLEWLQITGIDAGELTRWYTRVAEAGEPASTNRTLLRD